MANQYGPRIVTDNLVLCLDASDKNSYSGSGPTWYDLSGNNYNATIYNSPNFQMVIYSLEVPLLIQNMLQLHLTKVF